MKKILYNYHEHLTKRLSQAVQRGVFCTKEKLYFFIWKRLSSILKRKDQKLKNKINELLSFDIYIYQ